METAVTAANRRAVTVVGALLCQRLPAVQTAVTAANRRAVTVAGVLSVRGYRQWRRRSLQPTDGL